MIPNWQTTASKESSGKGRLHASAISNRTLGKLDLRERAKSSIASFTYESQQFDPAIKDLAVAGVKSWRHIFVERFEPVVAKYPMRIESSLEELADMLTAIIEGGIVVSRVMGGPQILAQQLLQFRTHVRLLFGDGVRAE